MDDNILSMEAITEIPHYPPLVSCALLDSRISHRTNIRGMVQSTGLFEHIIEPDSLDDALNMLATEDFDSCVLGPSISVVNINLFLKDVSNKIPNSTCSFVVLRDDNSHEDLDGVHSSVMYPCSHSEFNRAIVDGLQKANGNTLSFSRRINPHTGEAINLLDAIERLNLECKEEGFYNSKTNTSSHVLIEKLFALEPNYLMFRQDGTPSQKTLETVRGIVSSVYPNVEKNELLDEFKFDLENFLFEWIRNAKDLGKKLANKTLKDRLLNYFQKIDN